jgi:hypothetical protein
MTRTFQDHDFLVWEVYPSAGRHGFSDNAHIIFHCVTDRDRRSRIVPTTGDEADAQKLVQEAADAELLSMLAKAAPLP